MAFDPNLSTPKDLVRLLLGDTATPEKFDDATITAMLVLNSNPYFVAAALADSLSARYATTVSSSITVDGLTVDKGASEASAHYAALASRLRAEGAANGGVPGAQGFLTGPLISGISTSAMDAVDGDSDRMPSAFTMGQRYRLRDPNDPVSP